MKLKQKIFLIVLGLTFSFLLLEGTLRLSGWVYYLYRIDNKVSRSDTKGVTRILCLGDSWTFGEGAPKGYSYPEQLQRMLDDDLGGEFVVYNRGVPGSNSSQVSRDLEENIEKYAPDIIVMLTGCNNNSNFKENNCFLFVDSAEGAFLARLRSYFSHLQSYKLFETVVINIRWKIRSRLLRSDYFSEKDKEAFESALNKQNEHKIEKVSEELAKEASEHIKLGELYSSQEKITLAVNEIKKAIEIDPYNYNAYAVLGGLYLHKATYLLDESQRYLLAAELFEKAIGLNHPDIGVRLGLVTAYYKSGKKDLVLEELKTIHRLEPGEEWISRLLIYGVPDFYDMEIFDKTLKYDFQNIIALVLSKRIKLFLMSYTLGWPNDTLREIASTHKLPFIDNEYFFEKLVSSDGYKGQDHFAEDGHCNANGYRIIAENVYKALNAEAKEMFL